jgi:hypothetical protein
MANNIKSEKHHWWPQCVSKRWFNNKNEIHQLPWNGHYIPLQTSTKKFGAIGNAHTIKYSTYPTEWDESFENFFAVADGNFPNILDWLIDLQGKQLSLQEEHENFDILLECLLSLVVRSPRFRNQQKLNVNIITGQKVEENLIKLNQKPALDHFMNELRGQGKFAVLFSKEKEFIFGDGFYHNFTHSFGNLEERRMIVPLLPNMCVFYNRPISSRRYPRLVTKELSKDDVDFINETTMAYSRDFIFYKSQKPVITKNFSDRKFFEYNPSNGGDPIIKAFAEVFK